MLYSNYFFLIILSSLMGTSFFYHTNTSTHTSYHQGIDLCLTELSDACSRQRPHRAYPMVAQAPSTPRATPCAPVEDVPGPIKVSHLTYSSLITFCVCLLTSSLTIHAKHGCYLSSKKHSQGGKPTSTYSQGGAAGGDDYWGSEFHDQKPDKNGRKRKSAR